VIAGEGPDQVTAIAVSNDHRLCEQGWQIESQRDVDYDVLLHARSLLSVGSDPDDRGKIHFSIRSQISAQSWLVGRPDVSERWVRRQPGRNLFRVRIQRLVKGHLKIAAAIIDQHIVSGRPVVLVNVASQKI